MRLKSVWISEYKNLKDFTLTFDNDSFIDIFVGKNGSGKSNLFEALIEIFRHIYEFDKTGVNIYFEYEIIYEIDGTDTTISYKEEKLEIDGKERKTVGKTPLPDNVLIYYSGHNSVISTLLKTYEDSFAKRIKKADSDEIRRFIGIGPEYKELLLAVLLMQPGEKKARDFICKKLGIVSVSYEVKMVLKRPSYAEGHAYNIDPYVPESSYWKPEGITKAFLDNLLECISPHKEGPMRTEGYITDDDKYIQYFDINKIKEKFEGSSSLDIFKQLDNLKTIGMLSEITIPIALTNGVEASIRHFSDGQFQSVYIYAITELFKDLNCITLLDEPDSFLHPEWQFDFLKQVFDITEAATNTNHVLMSTHSAATLFNFDKQEINLFKIENSKVSCVKQTKKEIIDELSNSFIQYSEDESKLLIDNVIRSSSRPILFVEGPSDVSVLNTAYNKLYPGEDIPILIQDAFDRGFIKILLARQEIFQTYPDKQFFGLFDFDDAYDDWRSLGGEHVVTDVGLGLCRKLDDKKAHGFLLPIPDNELRLQVWNEDNPVEKVIPKPHFCIEHVFWGAEGVDESWFREKHGHIEFKGDKHKVRFAKEIVPTFKADCFEPFRPMFDLIKTKCE